MSVNSNGYIHLGGNIRNIYILTVFLFSFMSVGWGLEEGDYLPEYVQDWEIPVCHAVSPPYTDAYPQEIGDIVTLGDYNWESNGGNYKIIITLSPPNTHK